MKTQDVIKKLLVQGGGHLSLCGSQLESCDHSRLNSIFQEVVRSQRLQPAEWNFEMHIELADDELPVLELSRVKLVITHRPPAHTVRSFSLLALLKWRLGLQK